MAFSLSQRNRKADQHSKLRGKGFGAGNADFRPRMRWQYGVCLACNGTTIDINQPNSG